ncbi:hypothetical protein [Qipengyuania huizhouensis]|uniref:hypothetical protein n=1 Tax=Qipengyuania huizhouensis TaxID=2867245 RepID=UPI001C86E0B6|nr:hypothetical protein [Qipengyuania huizhouensis]MBX7461781.1 hypothetical protein [Qipengyuania huizhouensis]
MPRLATRLQKLETVSQPPTLRPVLLVTPETDVDAELAAWQSRYGPCEAEPLLIHLVGLAPS